MPDIHYTIGDATQPAGTGNKIIAHVCNDIGGWGRGFVVALSRRWPEPERAYRNWHADQQPPFELGAIQLVEVEPGLRVANMIAQKGVKATKDGPPIRYEALSACLTELAHQAGLLDASVHMPRIGCGLAGGEWSIVEGLILDSVASRGVSVTVYDLPNHG